MKGVKGPYALISYNSKDKKYLVWKRSTWEKVSYDNLGGLYLLELIKYIVDCLMYQMVLNRDIPDNRIDSNLSNLRISPLLLNLKSFQTPEKSIDLLNVAFENTQSISNNHQTKRIQKDSEKSSADNHDSKTTFDVPDCQTGERLWRELSKLMPGRDWRFVRVDVRMAEYLEHKEKIIELMRPNLTVMDLVSCL
ncbi:hypothetical protein PPACK8108_LOCUS18405 [Phakopsora pachyrhizi]|uniref:Uncharacterized protein n=1 Tax=Phakopsora pachyrhizi TaxID=170000 RepID=A0AAV0BDV2_PHAPC|nr:hypothetical protein PPACK8108_LOCUS18405 [Phakopsora pachyrhizi]